MNIYKIQIDSEYEDDGLYSITFWFDDDPPRYLSLARDEYEDPEYIYIEYIDQKYGFKTKDIKYDFKENNISIELLNNNFKWNNKSILEFEISLKKVEDVKKTMNNIFNIGCKSKEPNVSF